LAIRKFSAEIHAIFNLFKPNQTKPNQNMSTQLWNLQPPGSSELRLPEHKVVRYDGWSDCEYLNIAENEIEDSGDDAETGDNA